MLSTFDLFDLDESAAIENEPLDIELWAEEQVSQPPRIIGDPAAAVYFDIETGPRPLEEIECFYQPLPAMLPWDDSMAKYGNAKKPELRAEKLAEQRAAYQSQLDNQAAAKQAHMAEWLSKAALSPVTGRVLLIGVLIGDTPWYYDGPNEADNLTAFWMFVEERLANRSPIIGHNSNGFDLPFLVRRSWSLGVPVPREVRQGRYWNPLFRDTMEQWNCGQRDFVKLNLLGQFFNVGQKTEGVQGGDFHKLWFGAMPADPWGTAEQQRAKAIEYNGTDLKLTAAVAAKMGMV